MQIRYGNIQDYDWLKQYDHHISSEILKKKLSYNEILVAFESEHIGFLRYSLFWDNTPFMNLLFIIEKYRGKSIGKQLVSFWEKEMELAGYCNVMTSTLANENAQHFYRKIGYLDIGEFVLPNEPKELIFYKDI